jgi:hypothetical protein
MNEDSGHLYDDDYHPKYFIQFLWEWLKWFKHFEVSITSFFVGTLWLIIFLHIKTNYGGWYLQDGAWLSLIGNLLEVGSIIFFYAFGSLIGMNIKIWRNKK